MERDIWMVRRHVSMVRRNIEHLTFEFKIDVSRTSASESIQNQEP